MIALLLLSLTQDPGALTLELQADRQRVRLDDEVVLTLRAESPLNDPIRINLPAVNGFEIIGRSERREVSTVGTTARIVVLELRLRATGVGTFRVGPARATQGTAVARSGSLDLTVTGQRATAADESPVLNPRVKELLARAPPPPPGDKASLTILVSSDEVVVGEQVDIVTAAWFPRDLRLQLRRPPTLEVPTVDGVWSYAQKSHPGIAASRQVNGRWYDLFIVHQVVFPLHPGKVTVGSASLQYSVPRAFQFFSQDEPFSMKSPEKTIRVSPVPDRGRPGESVGATGVGLSINRRVEPGPIRAGEPVAIEVTVSGDGNVSVWPEPDVEWPEGMRTYEDRTDDHMEMTGGVVGGSKTFRYIAVPDSGGMLRLPEIRYPYFNPDRGRWQLASADPATLAVVPRTSPAASRAMPPPLLRGDGPSLAWTLVHRIPSAIWIAILLLPPSAALFLWLNGGKWRKQGRAAPILGGLRGAEVELERVLRQIIGENASHDTAGVKAALRAAGLSADVASQVVSLRQRIDAARYGPRSPESADLIIETREVVNRLRGTDPKGRRMVAALVIVLLAGTIGTTVAQAPSAESLYEIGAFQAAADSFAARAAGSPAVAAHWYNLGAAHYRLGHDGQSLAHWSRARSLAPGNQTIIRALRLVPPPDDGSARMLGRAPFTAEEAWVLAGLLWIAGWTVVVMTGKVRGPAAWLLTVAIVGGFAGLGVRVWNARPVSVVINDEVLRLSPHGLAPEVSQVPGGTAVRMENQINGWALVELPGGAEGWIPVAELRGMGNGEWGIGRED